MRLSAYIVFVGLSLTTSQNAHGSVPCPFDMAKLSFKSSAVEQAICLLRRVERWGKLSNQEDRLPEPLGNILDKPITVTVASFRAYLSSKGIREQDIGGNLTLPLSSARNNRSDAPPAKYFVIHDTSTPNYGIEDFPQNINDSVWEYNDLSRWDSGEKSKVHVFVNRVGESLTAVKFSIPWRATKFELGYGNLDPKGLFVHVELVQPRKSAVPGPNGNDAIAPDPGFTKSQYERLAVIYVATSLRRKEWLIPAFHATLDAGKSDGHDDPQNFSLPLWVQSLNELLSATQSMPSDSPQSPGSPSPNEENPGVTPPSGGSIDKCTTEPFTAVTSNRGPVPFPASGKFVLESHLATTSDSFPDGRAFPSSKTENIPAHLDNSCQEIKKINKDIIDCTSIYSSKYHKEWTPPEHGKAGQGSVGDVKPSVREEMFSGNMMWASDKKPAPGTKFLASYNGKTVVFVMGYETGPSDSKWLGGLQGEVLYFLDANDESEITITKLKDQNLLPGPIVCQ